jgi:acyl dehydratase
MKFADFQVGQTITAGSYRVDESEIIEFASRFDPQPFHIDKEAARDSKWGGIIASGFHTCAIAMRLMVDHVLRDSESCGSPGLEYINWPAPVIVGDTLSLQLEVLDLRQSQSRAYNVLRSRWRLFNQSGHVVLELVATSLFGGCGRSAGEQPNAPVIA